MHEAFFFGPGDRRLFGSYHPPSGAGPGDVLTLVCPPLFNDYVRTYDSLRQVATAVAEAGHHVLRFDYGGTGDSAGRLEDATVAGWLDDIGRALDEGRALSGARRVRLLAVRAGALLACSSGPAGQAERVVLWDPIATGAAYLGELVRVQLRMVEENIDLTRAERLEALRDHASYRLPAGLVEGIRGLDLRTCIAHGALRVVASSRAAAEPFAGAPTEIVELPCDWQEVAEDLIVPHPVLERLIACLTS